MTIYSIYVLEQVFIFSYGGDGGFGTPYGPVVAHRQLSDMVVLLRFETCTCLPFLERENDVFHPAHLGQLIAERGEN